MKYMMTIVDTQGFWEKLPEAKRNELYNRVVQWWGEHAQKGQIVEGYQLQPPHTATTVRVRGGKAEVSDRSILVTDGPFNEAKETVGGYGILSVANLDEALAIAKSWPADATLEVRPVVERGGR